MRTLRASRALLLIASTATIGLLVARAQDAKPSPPKARAEDVKSIDAIVAAVYDVISGPKGQDRDWDRFRSLFVPGARLIPVARPKDGPAKARMIEVDDFARLVGEATKQDGFFESELSRKVERFGAIAHVFSTYESTREKGGKPFDRGINSFQLMNDGDRWWVVTIFWDRERPEAPIPAEYLPKK